MRRGCRGKSPAVARLHSVAVSSSKSLRSGLEGKRMDNPVKMLSLLSVKRGFAMLGAESVWLQVRWKQFD